ncbi:MAG TPA: hypothetical protein VFS43_22990 [Polyangiaceae bacterium]|nr:hypothetical protein [Polyangiaceae bacterium]
MPSINRLGSLLSVAFALWALALGACKGGAEASAEASADAPLDADALVEDHDAGSIAWTVGADGAVKARVSGEGGKQIKENLSGTLAWKSPAANAKAEVKTVPLALDQKTGLLIAAGPRLDADLTEVGYTLNVNGKPWSGTLHLPAGGTAELVASARASAEAGASLQGKVGPHGGVIQIVGEDRLELVVDEASGEVRVYLLDPELKVVAVGERKVTLAVNAEATAPEVVVLVPDAKGLYLKGALKAAVDPVRVTIAVHLGGKARVALVGLAPNAHLAVGAKAPRLKIKVKGAFDAPDVDLRAKAKGKADVKIAGPDVKIDGPGAKAKADLKVKGPDITIKPPEVKASAKAGAGAGAGAGGSAKAKAKVGFGVSVK